MMTRLSRTLVAAATALVALAATPALAHDRDGDGDRPAPRVVYPAPAPAPVYVPAPVVAVPAPAPVYEYGYRPVRWQSMRFDELRQEYRNLELARERFYATWHGNPVRRARFESWYAARRSELDSRRAELARFERHERHERWHG